MQAEHGIVLEHRNFRRVHSVHERDRLWILRMAVGWLEWREVGSDGRPRRFYRSSGSRPRVSLINAYGTSGRWPRIFDENKLNRPIEYDLSEPVHW